MVPIEQKDWTKEDRASKPGQNHPLDSTKWQKTVERTPRLVSNLEQPITTLKSTMKLSPPNHHKGAVLRSAFSKEAHCKSRNHHFGRIKMTPRRARLSLSRKLAPAEQRQTIKKSAYLCSRRGCGLSVFYPGWPGKSYSHLKARQGSCRGNTGRRPIFRRAVFKRSPPANNLNDGAYRLPHNFNHQRSDDYRNPRSAKILQIVHGPFIEPEQPHRGRRNRPAFQFE